MTPRTLFNIILKILGVFFIKDFLALIPQIISVFYFLTESEGSNEGIWTLITTLLILFVYAAISFYLIFRTHLIIDKLKLDQGFDEEKIPLNIHRSTVLSISIIVIGGILVVDEIPNLCRQLFSYFQEKRMIYGQTKPAIAYSLVSGIKIILGLILMIGQRPIVNMIEKTA